MVCLQPLYACKKNPDLPPLYHSVCNTMSNCQFTFCFIKHISFTVKSGCGLVYTHWQQLQYRSYYKLWRRWGCYYDITYCSMWVGT